MASRGIAISIQPNRLCRWAVMGSALLASLLVGIPACAQPAPATNPESKAVLPPLTAATLLADVNANPNVTAALAARDQAEQAFLEAIVAHGLYHPDTVQLAAAFNEAHNAWGTAFEVVLNQQIAHLLSQGHAKQTIADAPRGSHVQSLKFPKPIVPFDIKQAEVVEGAPGVAVGRQQLL